MRQHPLKAWLLVAVTCTLGLTVACTGPGQPTPSSVLPFDPTAPGEIAVYLTGYTWHDNTPPGDRISQPREAGARASGSGTWDDPITVAVGHSLASGQDVLDFPAGTLFYVPSLRRYLIVEDTCGDGPEPEDGPCHRLDDPDNPAPEGASAWLDVWVDGRDVDEETAHACARRLTGLHMVVVNPSAGYVVADGEGVLQDSFCDVGYGEEAAAE